jgi:hypothetical protein
VKNLTSDSNGDGWTDPNYGPGGSDDPIENPGLYAGGGKKLYVGELTPVSVAQEVVFGGANWC